MLGPMWSKEQRSVFLPPLSQPVWALMDTWASWRPHCECGPGHVSAFPSGSWDSCDGMGTEEERRNKGLTEADHSDWSVETCEVSPLDILGSNWSTLKGEEPAPSVTLIGDYIYMYILYMCIYA